MAVYEDDTEDESTPAAETKSAPAKQSFKEAFASARSGGGKDFEWNGKKYTTELASEKKSAPAPSKPAPKVEAPAAKAEAPATKKEMYRDMSGKMREKAPDTSAADSAARREKVGAALKSAASSVGDYMSKLGQREEKHGTYVRNGKVERYAKGGSVSSASRRGDGIASKGKTRGKLC